MLSQDQLTSFSRSFHMQMEIVSQFGGEGLGKCSLSETMKAGLSGVQ